MSAAAVSAAATPTVLSRLEEGLEEAIEARCDLRLKVRKDPRSVSAETLEAADAVIEDQARAVLKHLLNGETEGVIAALHSTDSETYDQTFKRLEGRGGFSPHVLELLRYSYRRPTRNMAEISRLAFETASPAEARQEVLGGGGR